MTPTILDKNTFKYTFETSDGPRSLSDYQNQSIVLYFYPKDNTSGCTLEAQEFRDAKKEFIKHNTVILGVSRDSLKSHEKFIANHQLNFTLISDPNETLCNMFGVMKEKSLYGRRYMGIERSTFLFNNAGKLVKEWRDVKVKNHVAEVLDAIKTM